MFVFHGMNDLKCNPSLQYGIQSFHGDSIPYEIPNDSIYGIHCSLWNTSFYSILYRIHRTGYNIFTDHTNRAQVGNHRQSIRPRYTLIPGSLRRPLFLPRPTRAKCLLFSHPVVKARLMYSQHLTGALWWVIVGTTANTGGSQNEHERVKLCNVAKNMSKKGRVCLWNVDYYRHAG